MFAAAVSHERLGVGGRNRARSNRLGALHIALAFTGVETINALVILAVIRFRQTQNTKMPHEELSWQRTHYGQSCVRQCHDCNALCFTIVASVLRELRPCTWSKYVD